MPDACLVYQREITDESWNQLALIPGHGDSHQRLLDNSGMLDDAYIVTSAKGLPHPWLFFPHFGVVC